jgi:dolichol-phosphate mannosyltransferase
LELRLHEVAHEILVVDDGSTDATWQILEDLHVRIPELRAIRNQNTHGFGRAVVYGLNEITGDAVIIMMADESDDCRDVVRYWNTLNQGWECVFGSRFISGGGTIEYPWLKLILNRIVNLLIRILFQIRLNDTTNPFKAYHRRLPVAYSAPFQSHSRGSA